MLAAAIVIAAPPPARVAMKEIVPSPQTHPLAELRASVEIQNAQRSRDGLEIKLTIENGGRKPITIAEPIFSAFLAQADGTTLRDANDEAKFSCVPGATNQPQVITIAPLKTWQSSLRIRQVLRPASQPAPRVASTETTGTMSSPAFVSPAVAIPRGTYEVYTLLLIASASKDPDTAPKRMLQAQVPGIEVTRN